MLNPQTRRAHKVHLAAASEDLIRRGALLLEDALHTASLPGSNGRLLIVKSLHVGAIRPDSSSATLALAIERRLRDVVPVHASSPTAHLREAVYFRDDTEPSVMLALRLARRESTSAWFWRLAVPAWKPEMPLDDALRTIFFNVTRAKAGLAAAVRLVDELEERHALDPLLAAIHPQDGVGLMRAFGWSKPSEIPLEMSIKIPARWRTVLTRWLAYWGQNDARILWLAGVAMAVENPIRLLDGDLMKRAARVVEALANVGGTRHAAPLQTTSDEAANVGAGQRPVQDNHTQAVGARSRAPNNSPISRPDIDPPVTQTSDALPGASPHSTLEISPAQRDAPAPWPDMPLKTQHAGLFFLIPVLARLGIAEFLTPELIEAEFPFHLLRFIGQRLGLPDDDPINAVLVTDSPYDPPSNFVAPESWRNGIANPGEPVLRRIGDRTVLFDSSGRLALGEDIAIGSKPTAAGNSNPLKGLVFEINSPFSGLDFDLAEGFEPSVMKIYDLLRLAWLTAARRWLRRNAHLGLAEVVARPGRITATRTHIDVFFDLAQADIRVRRAGLDIDPGWVAWLGRVVHFHYVEGDQ